MSEPTRGPNRGLHQRNDFASDIEDAGDFASNASNAMNMRLGSDIHHTYNTGPASRLPSVKDVVADRNKAIANADFGGIAEKATPNSKVATIANFADKFGKAGALGNTVSAAAYVAQNPSPGGVAGAAADQAAGWSAAVGAGWAAGEMFGDLYGLLTMLGAGIIYNIGVGDTVKDAVRDVVDDDSPPAPRAPSLYKPALPPDPFNSPNPADRPARSNDGVKNDTYNGQNSGPNRGLGDGGNKAAGTSSKAPSNKSDGSYFSDFGGGGGSAGQQARTGNDPSGPSRSEPSRSGGSEAGQSARRGNDPTGPSRSEPSRSDKTDKGQSPKNDTHNGQKSGPNRGLGDGGKSGSNKSDSGKSGSNKSDSGKSGSSKSDGGESARRGNDPAGPNRSKPIILDLDGDGIEITELSRSNVFMDSGGDGLLHRTAWAGAGDGVLFFDANGDGKIGETREYVFTEWDPTATGDFEALRAAFDSNGDGKLTAADAGFSKFKVLVTNADGSQTARTLTELGIREIGLLGDATHITLPDGSVITGQASFTRTNGTTGTVADVILVADAEGRRVVQREQTNAQGTRTVTSTAYDADGSLAYAITSVTSRDGRSISNAYDDDGDGVADRFQTINTVVDASGARTETLVNYVGNSLATAAVVNRTVTTTSSDRRTLTIERDSTGGGWFDQMETRGKLADGVSLNAVTDMARDGTVLRRSVETVSANGSASFANEAGAERGDLPHSRARRRHGQHRVRHYDRTVSKSRVAHNLHQKMLHRLVLPVVESKPRKRLSRACVL